MSTPPNLYFAIAYTPKKGRSEVVRQIQAYASELDGCLVSEDGIRRILQAREAIVISLPPVSRETVRDRAAMRGAAYPPLSGLQCVIS